MDERQKWTQEQLEALEMLRSRGDGEDDPAMGPIGETLKEDLELSGRLDRILDWDTRISEAMSDVPVPPQLAEQILQRLEASIDQPSLAQKSPSVDRRRRRLILVAIATGVGVASILIAIATVGRLPVMTPERIRSIACSRFEEVRESGLGSIVTESDVPVGFPYSPDLAEVHGTRWRAIADFGQAEAVAYDVFLFPNQRATVYVVRCRSSSLPTRPPRTPQFRTRNLAVAMWQVDGLVYVAVVEEGLEGGYLNLLKRPPGPLT